MYSCILGCSNLVAMWEVLTGDQVLTRAVFNHLMEVLELTLPYHEKTSTSAAGMITSKKVETPVPKSVCNNHWLYVFEYEIILP